MSHNHWNQISLPEGSELLRKEQFEYTNQKGTYLIEMFETMKEEYYAIGIPKGDGKVIVYGSPILPDKTVALQTVIDKIEREE